MALDPARDSGIAAVYILNGVVGTITNVFFLCILLIVDKKWTTGKKLMLFVHGNELLLLLVSVFPYASSMARNDPISIPECVLPSAMFHFTSMLEPLSIALMAGIRYKMIKAAQSGEFLEPVINKYFAAVLAFCGLIWTTDLSVSYGRGLVPQLSDYFLCIQPGQVYLIGILVIFFAMAPVVIYWTLQVVKAINAKSNSLSGQVGMKASRDAREAVRLITALTTSYYLFHIPRFVTFFINWYITPVVASTYQILIFFYLLHATMSPIISIALIRRYRKAFVGVLSGFTSLSSLKSSSTGTSSGSYTDSPRKSVQHSAPKRISVISEFESDVDIEIRSTKV